MWNKDSNSLFDYETNDYDISKIQINSGGSLRRNDKKLMFLSDSKLGEVRPRFGFMTSISAKEDAYELCFDEAIHTECITDKGMVDNPWLIIRHTHFPQNKGYKIREGNILKLGKVIFKVKEINIKDKYMNNIEQLKDRTIADQGINRGDEDYRAQNNNVSDNVAQLNHPTDNYLMDNVNFITIKRATEDCSREEPVTEPIKKTK